MRTNSEPPIAKSMMTRFIVRSKVSSEMPARATQPLREAKGSATTRSSSPARTCVTKTRPARARLRSAFDRIGWLPASSLAPRTRSAPSRSWTAYSGGLVTTAGGGESAPVDPRYRGACATCVDSWESMVAMSDDERTVTNSQPPRAITAAAAHAKTNARRRRIDIVTGRLRCGGGSPSLAPSRCPDTQTPHQSCPGGTSRTGRPHSTCPRRRSPRRRR